MAEPPLSIRAALDLPPHEMLRYLRSKDYRTTVNWAEAWHDDHVRAFTVAKVAQYDLLETIRQSLDDAWASGKPVDQWKAELIPELQKHGWWGVVTDPAVTGTGDAVFIGPKRLETIFATNFRMAAAAAEWKLMQAAKGLMPWLRYRTAGDERVRSSHAVLDDIVLPVDHPFWQVYFPPNDWGCRCRVVQLSDRDLIRLGLQVTPDDHLPQLAPRLFWRPGAATPEVAPGGVGAGFGYNPGVSWMRAFEPPMLDAPLAAPVVGLGGRQAPLPPAQALPADTILPADTTDADAVARFVERFRAVSQPAGDALLFTDNTGQPLLISERFFQRPDGSTKLTTERRSTILLLAETIINPDEIWYVWEKVATNRARTKFRWRLTRRFVARFRIEGEERHAFAAMQVGKHGWQGVTAFPTEAKYFEKEQVRGGVLAWRRADAED